jgi:hypothetical protein
MSRARFDSKDVRFEPFNGEINDRIENVYRTKYNNSAYLNPWVGDRARRAKVKVNHSDRRRLIGGN